MAQKFSDVLSQLNAELHRHDEVAIDDEMPAAEGKTTSEAAAEAIVEAGVMPLPPVDPVRYPRFESDGSTDGSFAPHGRG